MTRLILRWTLRAHLRNLAGTRLLGRRVFRLIRNDVCGKYSLLCLFAFDFKGSQRVNHLIFHCTSWRIVLTLHCSCLILVTIHGRMHVRNSAELLYLWTLLPRVTRVNRGQHAFLELHTLVDEIVLLIIGVRSEEP